VAHRRGFAIGEVAVIVEPESGSGITYLPDGLPPLLFAPQHNLKQLRIARQLGYGDDVLRLNAEHDLTHSMLCHMLAMRYSPTLADKVRGMPENAVNWAEETAVKAIQRFANMAGVSILDAAMKRFRH
jgi:hypothetical protein